ncbi:hypothetical protein PROFUN_05230 [Planoprotostelium fungivorum]|uniref:Uncharacterized protein n=1 Tax=Planoprotostelium fungivorum TaxID=1890364 RepID=A0A2P6NRI7_9EUKA|nr:hypothetical protein PROFUN_05230 [Planoprotostelium fungivorum]
MGVERTPSQVSITSTRSTSSASVETDRHIRVQAILQNDFTSVPNILSIVPPNEWSILADHLYAYHSEIDAWPLVLWASSQRSAGDMVLSDQQFHDMVLKRNVFSEQFVRWNKRLIQEFYQKAKLSYNDFNDFTGEDEKQKISDLLSIILQNYAECPFEDIPLMFLKTAAIFKGIIGLGDDYLDNMHLFYMGESIVPLVLNPTLVNLDDLHYVRPVKLQALLNECGRLLLRYGQIKKNPLEEPYQSMMKHWAETTTATVPLRFSFEEVEVMEKIWRAQRTINSKKLKKLEEAITELVEGHTDDARTDGLSETSEYGLCKFSDKLNDPKWKFSKQEKGITEYTWYKGEGIGGRVEAEIKGDISQLKKIVEDVFRNIKLFSHLEMEELDKETSTIQFRVHAPFPFSPRYISADIHYHTNNGESSAIFYYSERNKTPSGHQRAKMLLSGIQVTAKGRDRVKVAVMLHMDMCSSIPNWAASGQSSSIKKNISKLLRS